MTAIASNRIMAARVTMMLEDKPCHTTFHYGCDAALDPGDGDLFQTAWQTACLADLRGAVSQDVDFQEIYTYCIESFTCRVGLDNLHAKPGLVSDASLPSNIAACYQIKQYETNSRANNRFYLPGVPEGAVIDGLIDPSVIAGVMTDLANTLMTTVTITGSKNFKLCCVQRFLNNTKLIPPVGYYAHTVIPTRSTVSQRRRTTGARSFT